MRSIAGYILVIGLLIASVVQPAVALPAMSIPYITTPSFVFVKPEQAATLLIIETNTTRLACTDTEALAISFPQVMSPKTSRPIFSPVIAQTTSHAIVGDRTYTFADFTTV